jgi:hypothetical protein
MLFAPVPRVAPHGVVVALISLATQLLEDPDQRQALAPALCRVGGQQVVEIGAPSAKLWPQLVRTLIGKRRAPDRKTLRTLLRDRFGLRAISRIVLPLTKCSHRIRPIVSTTNIPHHPLLSPKAGRHQRDPQGSILDADPPAQGVKIGTPNNTQAVIHRWMLAPYGMDRHFWCAR